MDFVTGRSAHHEAQPREPLQFCLRAVWVGFWLLPGEE